MHQLIMVQDSIPDGVEQRQVNPAIKTLPAVFMVFFVDLNRADSFVFFVEDLILSFVQRLDVVEVPKAFIVCYFDSELFHHSLG
jgi:hypothetical protein